MPPLALFSEELKAIGNERESRYDLLKRLIAAGGVDAETDAAAFATLYSEMLTVGRFTGFTAFLNWATVESLRPGWGAFLRAWLDGEKVAMTGRVIETVRRGVF